MTPAVQGIVSDLCHVLGVDMKTVTRISILPNRVVVDLVDHARMIEHTKTFPYNGPSDEALAKRKARARAD